MPGAIMNALSFSSVPGASCCAGKNEQPNQSSTSAGMTHSCAAFARASAPADLRTHMPLKEISLAGLVVASVVILLCEHSKELP